MTARDGFTLRGLTHAARRALGIDDLLLVVHDPSFPSESTEDIGRGTPYSLGARRLCAFADQLGFTGLQLGPQGDTTPGNRSPYDSTVFSRSPQSICLASLHRDPDWAQILDSAALEAAISGAPPARGRVHHGYSERAHTSVLDLAYRQFRCSASPDLRQRWDGFRKEAAAWLDHDVAFEVHAHGCDVSNGGPCPSTGHEAAGAAAEIADRYAFAQFVVHTQHSAFRDQLRAMGWSVFGDMTVGLSLRDRWRRGHLFVPSYAMGAPPSRTNPLGQPWDYPLLVPQCALATAFFRERVRKMAREYDGLRIDHPHGLVCPWVYDRLAADPLAAVQGGARFFESPNLPDHPLLARHAIARPQQLNGSVRRYDDGWVTSLDEEQLQRYEGRFEIILGELSAHGAARVACEVLSTAPYPLVHVLARRGLGRFRVTQKANLADPQDVYRSDRAAPSDWMMVGTHDTPPLARVIDGWAGTTIADRAAYLATRLVSDPRHRPAWERDLCADRSRLTRAMYADLFAGRARHVLVFVSDLFGLRDVYNRPGTVSDDNWALRVPRDFEAVYRDRLASGTAMDVAGALALALRAKDETARTFAGLAAELDEWSKALASIDA